jgi:hypothetical protein
MYTPCCRIFMIFIRAILLKWGGEIGCCNEIERNKGE